MNLRRIWSFRALGLALASVMATCIAQSGELDREAEEIAGCRRNLLLISDALRQYEKERGQVPAWLSDLLSGYVTPEFLTCPTAARKGMTSVGLTRRPGVSDPRFPTSYFYEFNPGLAPATGKDRTNREKAERQMQQFGPGIPIVRCFKVHSDTFALNLARDGAIYESGINWEDVCPSRVDLAPFSNVSPADGRAGSTGGWADLPKGWQKFGDVNFEIAGAVQLASSNTAQSFPPRADSIPVDRKLKTPRRLHLLLGCVGTVPPNTEIARLLLHSEKAIQPEVISIHYGRDVHCPPTPANDAGAATVAWERNGLRVCQIVIANPNPGRRLRAIDFESSLTASAPFLLGLTVEP